MTFFNSYYNACPLKFTADIELGRFFFFQKPTLTNEPAYCSSPVTLEDKYIFQ